MYTTVHARPIVGPFILGVVLDIGSLCSSHAVHKQVYICVFSSFGCPIDLLKTFTIAGPIKRNHGEEKPRPLKKCKNLVSDELDLMDIGKFVGQRQIDDDVKYNIIKNHWRPPPSFNFPFREFGKKNVVHHRFNPAGMQEQQN